MTQDKEHQELFNLMLHHKLVEEMDDKYRVNPNFGDYLNSVLNYNSPANGLVQAILTYCPEASTVERTLLAGGFIRVLRIMPGCQELAYAIREELKQIGSSEEGDNGLKFYLGKFNEEKLRK